MTDWDDALARAKVPNAKQRRVMKEITKIRLCERSFKRDQCLPAECYCGDAIVRIPPRWVGKFTKSCGQSDCVHPAMTRRSP